MITKDVRNWLGALTFLISLCLSGCQSGNAPASSPIETNRSLAPQRVDIRGSILSSQYSDGQVILEVERLSPSPDSRYDRAYVLVLPTAQMVDSEGLSVSISELRPGQNVAILLRAGGQGNRTGIGVARKLWIEDRF
ncbi:hypothetical protein ABID22_003897 [Pontibacter aydingkolensis]|uniref:Lipoprotein n=1 Tax=Pontibacter aydingkolensis TaxID=1911536 RepID=A0ABS7CZD8_9BACT|nr:hypothetical protein [Pontibacter aydingkolensis]MBW7469181.1 hypothetical protein [Pontibacter aydingkolensis]